MGLKLPLIFSVKTRILLVFGRREQETNKNNNPVNTLKSEFTYLQNEKIPTYALVEDSIHSDSWSTQSQDLFLPLIILTVREVVFIPEAHTSSLF